MATNGQNVKSGTEGSVVRRNITTSGWWPFILGGWLFLVLLWLIPHFETTGLPLSPLARLQLETQIRDTWSKILWAAITLLGASVVWKYLRQLAEVVEKQSLTLAAAERNAFFIAQAAATERYSRAMSLLGGEKVEVRLGGIYSLERLARESQQDHGAVMEVLAAFVREHAGWQENEPVPARPAADVQAIVTVLGRRHAAFDPEATRIDLHGVALARAYMPWVNFRNAFLYESNFEGAILQNADLRGAWMWKANFKDAVLDGAHLEGADLTGASHVTPEQLRVVHLDKTTKLPEYLRDAVDTSQTSAPPPATDDDLKLPSKR